MIFRAKRIICKRAMFHSNDDFLRVVYVRNFETKIQPLPPEPAVPSWSLESGNVGVGSAGANGEWRSRIREGIWCSKYFKKLQENNRNTNVKTEL